MGDLLMSLPVVHALRRSFPEARLTLLIKQDLLPLLGGHPDLDRILAFDPAEGQGWAAMLRWGSRLKSHRFDTALVLNPTRLFHVAVFLAGIPRRIGVRRKWGFLLNAGFEDMKSIRKRHEADYNLELLEALDIQNPPVELSLPTTAAQDEEAGSLFYLNDRPGKPAPIALHPWTSNPMKGLPLDWFQNVAEELNRRGRAVAWIGEPGSGPRAEGLAPGLDLTGKIPLRLLPAALKRCALLISNDSGPVHAAAAVGTPVIVVAPESHRPTLERWEPIGQGHTLLFSPTAQETADSADQLLSKGSLDADRPGLRK